MSNVREVLDIYQDRYITLNGYNATAYEYPDNKIYILEDIKATEEDESVDSSGLIVDVPRFVKTVIHSKGKFKTR